ncbi:MAG: preprotein translocase subunit SecE [Gemmatimonadales bacterium]
MEQAQAEPQGNKLVTGVRSARQFLLDTKAELKKVVWPTKEELLDATKRVILMTVLIGTLIGLLDLVLKKILVDGVAALIR